MVGEVMKRIAFCDDDLISLEQMKVFTENYRSYKEKDLECVYFSSPIEMLEEMAKGKKYDIIFMDIMMPGENGINVATEIRQHDDNVKIIFVTSYPDFAVDSYAVRAFYYQLKPIDEEVFTKIMDCVVEECEKEQNRSIVAKCKNGITRIDLNHLYYCEVSRRTLIFHMKNDITYEYPGSLDYLSGQLAQYKNFVRPHRSYLVNMDFIVNISTRSITLVDGTEIPIPHGKFSEVKDEFIKHAFNRNQLFIE